MRFKKLELLGFKSFADATELLFEPGVTAIVGPNGCGKSNVADAIKWVLGEQSARELRGGRMEDLIFNGSDQRDPLSYAEVSLTLDNADKKLPIEYSEVTIARRLFRSGESEYLLNQTAVRLKDIHELLMGTGIGTSAYSLFEQGRIEQIISARPEDRRVIFEEAAGITKFKSQKRESLRKLEETDANLARVNDVIAEVKRQIQSLERQVRRATSYREQLEELKNCEIRSAQHERNRLKEKRHYTNAILQDLQAKISECETEQNGQEGQLGQIRERVSHEEKALAFAREELLKATHQKKSLAQRLETARERILESKKQCVQMDDDIARMSTQRGECAIQKEALTVLCAQSDAQRQAKEREVAESENRLAECAAKIVEVHQTITQIQERMLDETAAEVQRTNELTKVNQESTRLEARISRLGTEEGKMKIERDETTAQVRFLEQTFLQAKDALEETARQRTLEREKLAAIDARLSSVQQEIATLEQKSATLESQMGFLKGLLASHEGYSGGVKMLLTALDHNQLSREGISGVLAELIQVGQEDAAAVDTALGPLAEAVVVESAAVVERCRHFLEKAKGGQILFLIRDHVPPMAQTDGRTPERTSASALCDRIGVTPHLEPLLKFLLGETWLVQDRKTAMALLPSWNGSGDFQATHPFLTARFVTPAGELFTWTSGQVGFSSSEELFVIGRTSRLQSLEIAFGQTVNHWEGAKAQFSIVHTEQRTQLDQVEKVESLFQERTQEFHRIEASVLSAQSTLPKLEEKEILLKTEQAQSTGELNVLNARIWELEGWLAAKKEGIKILSKTIDKCQSEISSVSQLKEETAIVCATMKAEIASFEEVMASRRASLQVLEQMIQNMQSQQSASREEIHRLKESETQWEESCRQCEADLKEMAEGETSMCASVLEVEKRKEEAYERLHLQERHWMTMARQMEQLQSQLHTHEMEQAQLLFHEEQLANRLSQVYQVNLGEMVPTTEPPLTEEEVQTLQARVQELSEKMQRIGPVNLGSIEEEKELKERYEFLVNQQADLTKAKDDLHQVISKISRTTRAMFRETFDAIHKEFQATFKQLFQGGEARLVLMDEEDLLESGIEIIARPPGKPLQAITLLSGGEKALTSIALLFAIFRVKPSPFCLLDEIDAPLDEANVDRFTRALKEFVKESQFIIITHNKKTMVMADLLYGITMAESGVSKIVSVKLTKTEENGHSPTLVETNQVESVHTNGNGNGLHSPILVLNPTQ